jgi:hypothetical protein
MHWPLVSPPASLLQAAGSPKLRQRRPAAPSPTSNSPTSLRHYYVAYRYMVFAIVLPTPSPGSR